MYGAVTSLSSLVISALAVAPAGGTTTANAESHGTAVAAERAAAAGITFGHCPKTEMLPAPDPVRHGRGPARLRRPVGPSDLPDRQPGEGERQAGRAPGRVRLQPRRPRRLQHVLPAGRRSSPSGSGSPGRTTSSATPRAASAAPPRCPARTRPTSPRRRPWPRCTPPPSYKQERIAQAQAYAQGCARSAGPALRHYTSLNNARDLDVLRAALGEQRLTFMGASYGTYFGALYATLFPSHVRRMVFDSAVNPEPGPDLVPQQPRPVARLREPLGGLPRLGRQARRRRTTWAPRPRRWRAATRRRAHGSRTKPAGGTVGPGQLHAAFLGAGYYDDYWAPRATALAEYLKGNAEAADRAGRAAAGRRRGRRRTATPSTPPSSATTRPGRRDWEVWDRDNTALARRAPFETWDNAWMNLPCAFWPAPRQQPLDVRTKHGRAAADADPGRRAGRGDAVRGGAGAGAAAGGLRADHGEGRRHARHRRRQQRAASTPTWRTYLLTRRDAGAARCVRAAPGAGPGVAGRGARRRRRLPHVV